MNREHHYNRERLIDKFNKGENIKYIFFWGHTRKHNEEIGKYCFSQWFELPFEVEGMKYPTAEHWMMAEKARLFGDFKTFEKIIATGKPGAAKELGREVLNFDEQTWNDKRFEIVVQGNVHKFGQHPDFEDFLLKTGERVLVEASPLDKVWGIGLAEDREEARRPDQWRGSNLLGFALMAARDILRDGHGGR